MEPIDTLLLIPLYSILLYIPIMCYLDIRYREVQHEYWYPLVLVNVPVAIYLYVSGWYPPEAFVISVVMGVIFFQVMKYGLLNGADFLFLAFIALFWIVNPSPWPHGIQAQFYVYLIVAMLLTAAALPFANYLRGNRSDNLYELMSNYPRGVPYMIPISLAFILSWLLG